MSQIRPYVLCLHGFTGNGFDWLKLKLDLYYQYEMETLIVLGHGLEAPKNPKLYSMQKVSEKIWKTYSNNQEQFNLLGYSMGGRLVLYMATKHPRRIKSLTLISASPGLKTKAERDARRKADNELADKIEANGMDWFVDYWENLPLWDSQSPELKAYLRQFRSERNPIGLANSLRGMGTGAMPSLWDKLADLPMPVKLIVGELDTKFVAINQEMATLIPNAELTIIPDAGHATHLEKPDAFKESLLEFLEKHKTS